MPKKRKPTKSKCRPFSEARVFVHALNLKSYQEWCDYCRSGKKPADIPSQPNITYRGKYIGIGDWLGIKGTRNYKQVYRDYSEACAFVRTLDLKNTEEWRDYCRSGKKPVDIPSRPKRAYRDKFMGMGNWLGTGRIAPSKRVYRDYSEAHAFVHTLGLKDQKEWLGYCRSGKKPVDIPIHPHKAYRGEFVSISDWLGTDTITLQTDIP